MDELVYKIEKIVKQCGSKMLQANQEDLGIENKEGIGNIVTKYDKEIQNILKDELLNLLPDASFIGEEEDLHSEILNKGYTYIVDPIDGTTNFARGLSVSAVSVGLLKDGEQYIAVCYNPYLNEMFTAEKGKGAYLNNKPIKVSNKILKQGIVLTGSAPYYEELRKQTFKLMQNFIGVATDFRRFASAVMDLCNIACGRAEVYFEVILQPWDYAAGALIVEEAGGKVTQINGEKITFDKPCSIVASNNKEDYFKYIEQ